MGGSAADSRILRDVVHREGGLRVPAENYYLCDNGYANAEGFLTPYKGVHYHLREWDRGSGGPQNWQKLFNLKHSSRVTSLRERSVYLMSIRDWVGMAAAVWSVEDDNAWDDYVKRGGAGEQARLLRPNGRMESGYKFCWVEEDTPLSFNVNRDPTMNSSSATKRTGSTSMKRKVHELSGDIPRLVEMVSTFCESADIRMEP
ncbi:UNVERIFIED_CONTAM: hypothetical protein Sradi_0219500 [Sesamum radiatum]|uniref:DDE Tnp4 domain-containing protein n=1 Tax=Sesamum radiatum TaxID=300843 RepID=A0AAW2W4G5_SESRA